MAINPQAETFNALQEQARRETEIGPKAQLLQELRNHPEFADMEAAAAGSGQLIIDALNDPLVTPAPLAGASAEAIRINQQIQREPVPSIINNIDTVILPGAAISAPERVALVNEAKNKVIRDFRAQLAALRTNNPQDVANLLAAFQGRITGDLTGLENEARAFAAQRIQEIEQTNAADQIRTGGNAAVLPTPVADIPDIAAAINAINNINGLAPVDLGPQADVLRREIAVRAVGLIEARINGYNAGDDLNTVAALDMEIAALPPGMLTAAEGARLLRLRNEKVRQAANKIRTDVQTTWNNMRGQFQSYDEAEAAVGPLIDQALLAANVGALAADPALAVINRAAFLADFQARDLSELSNQVNIFRTANPGADVNAYVALLTADQVRNFGGRDAIVRIFTRNTDEVQRNQFAQQIAEIIQQRGGAAADLAQLLTDNGFDLANFADLHDFADDQYERLANTQIRADLDRAVGFMNANLGWNELTLDGKQEMLNPGGRRAEVIQMLRDQGMTQAQIDRALDRMDLRLLAEQDIMNYDTEANPANEHFTNLRNAIAADTTLSANQREVLTRRLNLAETSMTSSTGFIENAMKSWFGYSQEQIDAWRGTAMWFRLQAVNVLALLKLTAVGGGVAVLLATGFPIPALLLAGTGAVVVAPSWWRDNRRVSAANEAALLSLAERRVAQDSLTELTRNTIGALNLIADNGGIAGLAIEERELLEQLGILQNGRVDITGLVGRIGQAAQEYGKTVDGLRTELDKRVRTIRGMGDPIKIAASGADPLNFNLPGNLLTGTSRRRK